MGSNGLAKILSECSFGMGPVRATVPEAMGSSVLCGKSGSNPFNT